jgi:ubiquinone/menaquinone biosynthesis C-methylase UbiE
VLDVGCGTGFIGLVLADPRYTVYASDIATGMVRQAVVNYRQAGFEPRVVLADAERLPWAPQCFDAVICRHLLWTLPHPGEAIKEWQTAVRAGGVVVVIDGHWCDQRIISRARRILAEVLTFWHDLRTPYRPRPRQQDYYSADVLRMLPLSASISPSHVVKLFKRESFTTVSWNYLRDIADAERSVLPLRRRLAYQQRFAVVGRMP